MKKIRVVVLSLILMTFCLMQNVAKAEQSVVFKQQSLQIDEKETFSFVSCDKLDAKMDANNNNEGIAFNNKMNICSTDSSNSITSISTNKKSTNLISPSAIPSIELDQNRPSTNTTPTTTLTTKPTTNQATTPATTKPKSAQSPSQIRAATRVQSENTKHLIEVQESIRIDFNPQNNFLQSKYNNNTREIANIKKLVAKYEDVILTGNGHIRIIANIPESQSENIFTINNAAIRAATISNYIRANFRFLTKWNFSFFVNPVPSASANSSNAHSLTVNYLALPLAMDAPAGIFFTDNKESTAAVKSVINKYGGIPHISRAVKFTNDDIPELSIETNKKATNPVAVIPDKSKTKPKDYLIAIYYRWDKSYLDSLYLSNPQSLKTLDSILNLSSARYIDTLNIVAFASPEGNVKHNQDLSEWRAATIREYIVANYPKIPESRIKTTASGENWQGVLKFAEQDQELPDREKVIQILKADIDPVTRQKQITSLSGGATYYRYILPNYYRFLRNGASILITYSPLMPIEGDLEPPPVFSSIEEEQPIKNVYKEVIKKKFPVAFRSNLLYDIMGAVNLGIEIPIAHFSLIVDGAYSYWRAPSHLFALQTLEAGAELRYWFPKSLKKTQSNPEWNKPLRGLNFGIYARYWERYDAQWINGYQGDNSWSAGLTLGYALPIAKNLTFEPSVGAGYFFTNQYRYYHKPEYDKDGNYRLMWQETGNFGSFSLTKLRFSLVYILNSNPAKKGGTK